VLLVGIFKQVAWQAAQMATFQLVWFFVLRLFQQSGLESIFKSKHGEHLIAMLTLEI
jgi:hypothetical protein